MPDEQFPAQRRRWLSALDACLVVLADHRLLDEAAGTLLDNVLFAFDTPHGYLQIGGVGEPIRATERRGCWADDRLADDAAAEALGADGAVAVSPVRWQDGTVGHLGIGFRAGSPLASRPDLDELVGRFARVIDIAYANSRLIAVERMGHLEESALLRAGQALSATLHLGDVLGAILDELRKVVPYDTASVQELSGDEMVIIGGHGFDMEIFGGLRFDAIGGGVPNSEVRRTKEPVIVADILGDHPYWDLPHDAHEMSGVRGWLGVPLMFGSQCIGMLTLDTFQPGFYTDAHAKTALAFAAQAAIALQNARAFERSQQEILERRRVALELESANDVLEQRMREIEALQESLREQAVRDPLTGLYNRRYLMENLQHEVRRAHRSHQPLAVALIDVDHFKEVNDTFGHDVGDQVLVQVGHFLEARVRESDVVCRYGGEEFVVVMPDTHLGAAVRRAEEWRIAMQDMTSLTGVLDQRITISVGVTSTEGGATTSQDLVRSADESMYLAKHRGRNQVVTTD